MTARRLLADFEGPSGASADAAVNLGMEFYQDVEGWATAIHFWRANSAVPGPVDVSIWEINPADRNTGTEVASTSMSWGQYDTGWITAVLNTPAHIEVGKFYKVQVNTTRYSASSNWFDQNAGQPGGNGLTNGPLHAPNAQDSRFNSQGSYRYGSPNITNSQFTGDNYWIDVTVDDVNPSASGPSLTRWDGTQWVTATAQRWNGSAWVAATITRN